MKKTEAKFQTVFNQYLRRTGRIGHFELKQARGDRFYFSKIEPHQIESLQAAGKSPFVWKYSDQDQRIKPFDCSCIPPLQGYIAIRFAKAFYIIQIEAILFLRDDLGWKSITEGDANMYGESRVSIGRL